MGQHVWTVQDDVAAHIGEDIVSAPDVSFRSCQHPVLSPMRASRSVLYRHEQEAGHFI